MTSETPKPEAKKPVKSASVAEVRAYHKLCEKHGEKPKTVTDDFGNVVDDVFGHGAELLELEKL